MSYKQLYIQIFVLILFSGALMLQSVSPLIMQQTGHGHSEAISCSIDSSGNASCSTEEGAMCNCTHTNPDSNSDEVTLCGCSHHGNVPIGTAPAFQIKAQLLSSVGFTPLTPLAKLIYQGDTCLSIWLDDVFHPPRHNA